MAAPINIDILRNAAQGRGLKVLTPEQLLGRLSKLLAQLKASNTSENLQNEIR